MSTWAAVKARASEDKTLPSSNKTLPSSKTCAQCFLRLCKKHPLQDHGEATARITSAGKDSTLDKMYEQLIAPQISKFKAAEDTEDAAAERAHRESNARERERAAKRKRRDVGDEARALGSSGLNGPLVKFMNDRDTALSSASSSSSSSSDDDERGARKEKKKRRKEEKKKIKKAAKKELKKKEKKAAKKSKKEKKKKEKKKEKRRNAAESDDDDAAAAEPVALPAILDTDSDSA